jgi:hypothetical protein
MSVSGILSSGFASQSVQNGQSKWDQIKQDFQQLGQDLQSGNLSAARADYSALQQLAPPNVSTTSTPGSHPLMQDLAQLGTDLQSGNLANAQQDYANMRQDIQNRMAAHHHHRGASSEMSQLVSQLGQALQSGNLSSAQEAYGSLQQDIENVAFASMMQSPGWNAPGSVSVSA